MNKFENKVVAIGIIQIDEQLGSGLLHGEIFLLAGRPGSGKTSLTLKIALRTASKHATKVLFCSFEMEALSAMKMQ